MILFNGRLFKRSAFKQINLNKLIWCNMVTIVKILTRSKSQFWFIYTVLFKLAFLYILKFLRIKIQSSFLIADHKLKDWAVVELRVN